jgi:hypothetical protein
MRRTDDEARGCGEPNFHFHEQISRLRYLPHRCDSCSPEHGKVYGAVDLANEAARAKAVRDFERLNKIRPLLVENRSSIEDELRRTSRGKWPPPHIVMDKLLEMSNQTRVQYPVPADDIESRFRQTSTSLIRRSFAQNNTKFSTPGLPNTPHRDVSDSNRNLVLKSISLKDWAQTPIYKIEIDGHNAADAILKSCPEFQILRMSNLSRPEEDPFALSTEELIAKTLEKAIQNTEVEYQIDLLKKIRYTDEQLLELY